MIHFPVKDKSWVGFKPGCGIWVGPLQSDFEALPLDAEVAVVDDLLFRPRLRRWGLAGLVTRFSLPFRNPSIIARGDLRGSVFFKIPAQEMGGWDLPRWTAEARKRLAVDNGKVERLPNSFRWLIWKRNAYRFEKAREPSRTAKSIRVVVCYRDRADLTCQILEDLKKQRLDAGVVELTLVNNQSDPKEVRKVLDSAKELVSPWKVLPLDYDKPYNHSAQNNLGLKDSGAEVFFILNNDVRLAAPNVIQELSNWALEPGVATAGPLILGTRGLVSAGTEIFPEPRLPGGAGIRESECEIYSREIRETSGNSFACAAVNAEVFRSLGGLDERAFPAQYNDTDFLIRAVKIGRRHLLVGTEEAFHQPGQTDSRRRPEEVRQAYGRLLDRHRDLARFLNRDPLIAGAGGVALLLGLVNGLVRKKSPGGV